MSRTMDGSQVGKLLAPKRNHFFYGQLLNEERLFADQDYFKNMDRLINRLGLGSGVLCGLELKVSADGEHILLSPGVAVDKLGRIIVVPCEYRFDPRQITDCSGKVIEPIPSDQVLSVAVSICYLECYAEYSPVLVSDCDKTGQCSPNAVVERFCVQVSKEQPKKVGVADSLCDALNAAAADAVERRTNLCEATTGGCPAAPENPCVVLGIVQLQDHAVQVDDPLGCGFRTNVYSNNDLLDMILCLAGRTGGGGTGQGVISVDAAEGPVVEAIYDPTFGHIHFEIPRGPAGKDGVSVQSADAESGKPVSAQFDPSSGKIHFVIPPGDPGKDGKDGTGINPNLTKINRISWTHEGDMPIGDFVTNGLDVSFNQLVSPTSIYPQGWFLVTVEYPINLPPGAPYLQQDTIFIQRVLGSFTFQPNRPQPFKTILFKPGPNYINTFQQTLTDGNINQVEWPVLCRVVVKCSYLVDPNGDVVDGDFLKNHIPSLGNGIQGGEFESWFRLIP